MWLGKALETAIGIRGYANKKHMNGVDPTKYKKQWNIL